VFAVEIQWLISDFPKRQNREDFCAIRERKLDNRERSTASRGTVHIAPAKLATHHRLKQNGSVLNPRSHGLIRKKATLLASRPQGVEYPWEKAMKAKGRRGRVFIDKNAEGKATGWSLAYRYLSDHHWPRTRSYRYCLVGDIGMAWLVMIVASA